MVLLLENSLQWRCTLSEIPTILKVRMESLFGHLRWVAVSVKARYLLSKAVPRSGCSLILFTSASSFCISFRTMAELLWLIQKGPENLNHNDQTIAHFIVGYPAVIDKHGSIYFFHIFRAIGKTKTKRINQTKNPRQTNKNSTQKKTTTTQNQLHLLVHLHQTASFSDTYRTIWWPFLVKLVWDK